MNYTGVIIEESLINTSIIQELQVIQTEVAKVTENENTPWLKQWTMQTVSIPENTMEKYANQLSKLIDTTHCDDWYCDFRNDRYHYVIFSNKVFKLNKNNRQDYIEMREYAISLGLPEQQLPNFNDLPLNLLKGFLIEAKKQSYANNNAKKVPSNRLGSTDYHYEDILEGEKMIYHDTYFGGIQFMGEEVVYRATDIPKWGMNYYGNVLNEQLSEETMNNILRLALMKVGEDDTIIPVRGPSIFEIGEYRYTFQCEGDMENFTGTEEIWKRNELIYRLCCHGGVIE